MALNSKNRKTIYDLSQPVQMAELNRQLDWIWTKLLGGLEMKSLNADAQEIINSKIGDELFNSFYEQTQDKFSWLIKSGDSAANMLLTDRLFYLVAQNIDLAGRVTFSALDSDLVKNFARVAGQTVINGDYIGTGKIKAEYLDVGNLTFKQIVNADGTGSSTVYTILKTWGNRYSNAVESVLGLGYGSVYNGEASFYNDYLEIRHNPDVSRIIAPNDLIISGSGTEIDLTASSADFSAHVRPSYSAHGVASLGTRGGNGERRFNNVNITGSVDNSSDRRLKKDIADLDVSDLMMKLRPRKFRMIADGDDAKWRWGFIAQEVGEVLNELGIDNAEFFGDENPDHLSLRYMELIAVLVEGYQKLHKRYRKQRKRIKKQGKRLATIEAQLETLLGGDDLR